MSDYTLTNHRTGEVHELDFENVADIKAALEQIRKFNAKEYPYDKKKKRKKILTWECFEDTREKMDAVTIPSTDY